MSSENISACQTDQHTDQCKSCLWWYPPNTLDEDGFCDDGHCPVDEHGLGKADSRRPVKES